MNIYKKISRVGLLALCCAAQLALPMMRRGADTLKRSFQMGTQNLRMAKPFQIPNRLFSTNPKSSDIGYSFRDSFKKSAKEDKTMQGLLAVILAEIGFLGYQLRKYALEKKERAKYQINNHDQYKANNMAVKDINTERSNWWDLERELKSSLRDPNLTTNEWASLHKMHKGLEKILASNYYEISARERARDAFERDGISQNFSIKKPFCTTLEKCRKDPIQKTYDHILQEYRRSPVKKAFDTTLEKYRNNMINQTRQSFQERALHLLQ